MANVEAVSSQMHSPPPQEIRSLIALEYAALAEYTEVSKNPVDGVFVIPSEKDPHKWLGTVAVVGGLYDGGIFRFELNFLPRRSSGPRVIFYPPVFHPLIDAATGEFDLAGKFPIWRTEDRLRHVLEYVKQSFQDPDPSGTSNLEASALLRQSRTDYRLRVSRVDILTSLQDFASESNASVASKLSFGPWIPELLEPEMQKMLDTGSKILDSRRKPE